MKIPIYIIPIMVLFLTTNSYSQRFFGLEYSYIGSQKPRSEKYDLNGETITYSHFMADISYGWTLDKKKKSTLLTTLDFSKTKVLIQIEDDEKQRFNSSIPYYLFTIPDIKNLGLSVLYDYSPNKKWSFNSMLSANITPKNKGAFNQQNFDCLGLLYAQRAVNKFAYGLGLAMFVFDGKVAPFPVVNIQYESKQLSVDFLAPLSVDIAYRFRDKWALTNVSSLDFGGFVYEEDAVGFTPSFTPEYVETRDFEFSFGLDYNFYQTFHANIKLGYMYRELEFTTASNNSDEMSLEDGIVIGFGLYSTF